MESTNRRRTAVVLILVYGTALVSLGYGLINVIRALRMTEVSRWGYLVYGIVFVLGYAFVGVPWLILKQRVLRLSPSCPALVPITRTNTYIMALIGVLLIVGIVVGLLT